MEQNVLQKLAAMLKGSPSPSTLGSGAANQAASTLQSGPYRMYVAEAQANGQQPVSYAEWMAQQGR